jgi:hypothetical protein
MPRGKRTDHISKRDLEVLDFIARFGIVPRSAVEVWANTGYAATVGRERRLRKEDLLRSVRGFGDIGTIVICTKLGLRASGRRELRPAHVSIPILIHETVVAGVAAQLERDGARLLSEREVLARDRAAGEHLLCARIPGGRFHRPDLIRVDADGSPIEAFEVELSTKAAGRLDAILRAWRRAVVEKRVERVVYCCARRTLPYVKRAVDRTRTESVVTIQQLPASEIPSVVV